MVQNPGFADIIPDIDWYQAENMAPNWPDTVNLQALFDEDIKEIYNMQIWEIYEAIILKLLQ